MFAVCQVGMRHMALIMICCLSGVMSAALPVVGPNETSDNRAANPYVGGRPFVPPPPVPQPPIQMPVQSGPPLYPNLPIPGALPIYPNPPVPGGPSGFGPQGSAFHLVGNQLPGAEMRITDTNVDCQKTIMIATFKLSRPFFGYVYPYGNFDKCILFAGKGETEIRLTMAQDMCGLPPPPRIPGVSMRVDPVIEHRLMFQWDTDLVQEYDTNVLIRCDRPDDYNRTIKFDLTSVVGEKQQAIVRTHPGPQMWMEIQRGEGPKALPLQGPVILGETLTMVFTLADDVFRFDSTVLNCWASDGNNERRMITWVDPNVPSVPTRPLSTYVSVIENSCSVKPKLFGHFNKIREEFPNQLATTQWALFKAFRFPTASRLVIQCDIQVCFEKCYYEPRCGEPFDARSSSRKRREANSTGTEQSSGLQAEQMTMFRAFEVLMPNEEDSAPMAVFNGTTMAIRMPKSDCISPATFYGIILGLGIALLVMIGFGAGYVHRQNKRLAGGNGTK